MEKQGLEMHLKTMNLGRQLQISRYEDHIVVFDVEVIFYVSETGVVLEL